MKKLVGVFIAGSLIASGAHAAQVQQAKKVRPVYTYAGVKLTSQGLDDFNCRQNGVTLDGSFDLNGQAFVRGSLSDVSGGGCGSTSLNVSAGYRAGWGETSHVYGIIGLDQVSPDNGSGDSGILLGGGIRGYIATGVEGYFEIDYRTMGDGDLSLNAGGAYWLNANFAGTLDLGFSSNQNSIAVGGRFTF